MSAETHHSDEWLSPAGEETAKWYAAYTRPGYENRVACQLQAQAIPFYLPIWQPARQPGHCLKNHRNANRLLPLFPGSIFVHMPWIDRSLILALPGVLSLLAGRRHPLPLPDFEIGILQASLSQVHARPHPYLDTGVCVRIESGPLRGLTGILQHQGPQVLVIVTLKAMSKSMVVVAEGWDLKLLQVPTRHALLPEVMQKGTVPPD